MRVVVLAGGFGGARMAHGFDLLRPSVDLSVVVNTADDLEVHGLHISPDIDTVMYTLAGLANTQTGWGVRDETWSASEMLDRYGEPTWFRLGDRDLATHIVRTALLRRGMPLTEVTARLSASLGIAARLLPATDDTVRTKVLTTDGWLDFQDYFVRRRHADEVLEVRFDGADAARPTDQATDAIERADLIVIAPSNPFVSIDPVLAVRALRSGLLSARAPVVAVSPIVAGQAVRGPAAAMLRARGREPSSREVAAHYAERHPGLIDFFVIDEADGSEAGSVAEIGLRPLVLPTLMPEPDDRRRLAELILDSVPGAADVGARTSA